MNLRFDFGGTSILIITYKKLMLQGYFLARVHIYICDLFVCVEVLRPSQPNGVMSSAVSLPNHTFTGQA